MSESVKGSEHRCLVGITIRERGSSEREKHLTYQRESLGFEESREQMRKREKRREIMRDQREIPELKRRGEY